MQSPSVDHIFRVTSNFNSDVEWFKDMKSASAYASDFSKRRNCRVGVFVKDGSSYEQVHIFQSGRKVK